MKKVIEIIKNHGITDYKKVLDFLEENYNSSVQVFVNEFVVDAKDAKIIKEWYTKEKNKKITDEEIILLLKSNKTSSEISSILKLAKQSVQRRIKKIYDSGILECENSIAYRPNKNPINETEYDVLIGGLLGDSWVGKTGENSKNCMGSFTHKIEHTEYVWFKYNLLKRLCAEPVIHNKFDKRSNRAYQQCYCKIRTNPLLNEIRDMVYDQDGQKRLKEEVILKLNPLGLAIFYMDDGTKTESGYILRMDAFLREDYIIIEKLFSKFNIQVNINRKDTVCYIPANEKIKFKTLIEEFVPMCMKYKL